MSSPARGAGRVGGIPRVNLLPRIEIDRRERLALARRWLVVVLVAMFAIAGISAGAYTLNSLASTRLASENARTTDLLGQISDLADVSKVRTAQRDLESFRTEAMGADVAWVPVYGVFEKVIPGDGVVIGWDLATGTLPGDGDPSDQAGVTGTLTISSPVPMDIVTMVRALRKQDGIIDADGALLERPDEEPAYEYTLTATWDQTVYTGAYSEKKDK